MLRLTAWSEARMTAIGVSGGGGEGTRLMVALSSANNDSAATGAKSFCSSTNDDMQDLTFVESVSTS